MGIPRAVRDLQDVGGKPTRVRVRRQGPLRARKITTEKPHRGDDRAKVAWQHERPCFVAGKRQDSPCSGRKTVHHDRRLGGKATDRKTVTACNGHHQHGPHAIETLGRSGFEAFFGILMEDETAHAEMLWQAHKSQESFDD